MLKGMSDPWRRFKSELRIDYYDIYDTHEERIALTNTPPGVKSEDWIKFCEHENDDSVQQNRAANKRKDNDMTTLIPPAASLIVW